MDWDALVGDERAEQGARHVDGDVRWWWQVIVYRVGKGRRKEWAKGCLGFCLGEVFRMGRNGTREGGYPFKHT